MKYQLYYNQKTIKMHPLFSHEEYSLLPFWVRLPWQVIFLPLIRICCLRGMLESIDWHLYWTPSEVLREWAVHSEATDGYLKMHLFHFAQKAYQTFCRVSEPGFSCCFGSYLKVGTSRRHSAPNTPNQGRAWIFRAFWGDQGRRQPSLFFSSSRLSSCAHCIWGLRFSCQMSS